MKLLVAGGRQERVAGVADRRHRPLYDLGVAAVLDVGAGTLTATFDHRGPGIGVGHRLGAPSIDGRDLVLCTEREVVRVGDTVTATSHPAFNDLHHAAVFAGRTHVVATGLDGVLVDGTFVPVVEGARLPEGDQRWVEHHDRAHPNYVFEADGRVWVTRGTLGDIVPLGGGDPVRVAEVVVHDGVASGDGVWFTSVDGRLVLLDPVAGRLVRTIVLRDEDPEPLGWCRGLWIGPDTAWVGFTRLRTTRLRHHLAWARGRLRGRPVASRRPTGLVEVELATGRLLRRIDTTAVGLDAIFGLVALPDPPPPSLRASA